MEVISTTDVGESPTGITATPGGELVFVTNRDSNTLSELQQSDDPNQLWPVVSTTDTGDSPVAVALAPDSDADGVANATDTDSDNDGITNTVLPIMMKLQKIARYRQALLLYEMKVRMTLMRTVWITYVILIPMVTAYRTILRPGRERQ